ncbi:MAG: flippase-like domain-containing protein [Balneolales bacterium]|nr:flippase-like domain-containing protein [Balneolales bacterium]
MKKNILNMVLSVLVGGLFLWLALRNLDVQEVWAYIRQMNYGWMAPYLFVALMSFWFRSERWKLLMEADKPGLRKANLFTGVMLGYAVNYAIPRAGELSRTIFLAKKENLSSSAVLGTVVLERIIDLLAMLLMLVLIIFFVVSDRATMDALFGPQLYLLLDELRSPLVFAVIIVTGLISLFLLWKAVRYILEKRRRDLDAGLESAGVKKIIYTFTDGITSVRKLRRWPLFAAYTAGIWICYGLLTYIPFYAFDMTAQYGLGLPEAFSVMVISTIGVVLPSPGGIGTYHWFVSQSLYVLFAVPAVTGVAFAFVTHLGMFAAVMLITPAAWFFTLLRKAPAAA